MTGAGAVGWAVVMARASRSCAPSAWPTWMAALLFTTAAGLGPAQAAGSSDRALAVLAAAKAAMGGPAWDRISGWRERGRHGEVAYETLLDFHRYGARFASTRNGATRVHGFNGTIVWDRGPDDKVAVSRAPAQLAEAEQSAYASTFAFFFPRRFPARFEDLGVRSDRGMTFDVVKVSPVGAAPIEVWVDHSTHLIARFVDRSGPKPVTALASDYRWVGGVREPFRIDVSDGDPARAQTVVVDSVVLEPVARSAFDPPA